MAQLDFLGDIMYKCPLGCHFLVIDRTTGSQTEEFYLDVRLWDDQFYRCTGTNYTIIRNPRLPQIKDKRGVIRWQGEIIGEADYHFSPGGKYRVGKPGEKPGR